ncbi:hypothetical protein BKA70DRAFT_1267750 [Coprinopsis sp. MPI-PUGE-AT-0042]|nr:hypothetical protein BKA70DRAFT_1267750 [Coprinopsis sp. MPI-PUGE-AT-0042]
MRAARHGREEAVTLFIAHPETLVNLVSNQGFSALMLAVNWGHEAIVRLLLDIPHLNTTTSSVKYGRTAMSIALDNGHTAIIQLLEEFELRQAQSDSELEEEVGTRYDSDSSGSYQDAEEWLERDDIVPP